MKFFFLAEDAEIILFFNVANYTAFRYGVLVRFFIQ